MKDEIELIKPDESFCEEISAYRKAFLQSGDSMDGTGKLRIMENPKDWLKFNYNVEHCNNMYRDFTKSIQFACVRKSDRKIVGMIQLRFYMNDFLEKYGGNIGYSVRPDERRKGYATWMLKEVLKEAEKAGMTKILITAYENNIASQKTILSQGGVYESTVFCPEEERNLKRFWINLRCPVRV